MGYLLVGWEEVVGKFVFIVERKNRVGPFEGSILKVRPSHHIKFHSQALCEPSHLGIQVVKLYKTITLIPNNFHNSAYVGSDKVEKHSSGFR